jgi:hypothetical protein
MGTQQLLLITLGVVLIGIMVAIGVFIFRDQSAATNRDSLINDLANHAARVQSYYRLPRVYGGGDRSFNGLTMARISSKPSNDNGVCSLEPDPVSGGPAFVTLTGVGTETGVDGLNPVKAVMLVFPDSVFVDESLGN